MFSFYIDLNISIIFNTRSPKNLGSRDDIDTKSLENTPSFADIEVHIMVLKFTLFFYQHHSVECWNAHFHRWQLSFRYIIYIWVSTRLDSLLLYICLLWAAFKQRRYCSKRWNVLLNTETGPWEPEGQNELYNYYKGMNHQPQQIQISEFTWM